MMTPIDDCLMLDYQVVNGAPGFEIETKDHTFWVLIAHGTPVLLVLA